MDAASPPPASTTSGGSQSADRAGHSPIPEYAAPAGSNVSVPQPPASVPSTPVPSGSMPPPAHPNNTDPATVAAAATAAAAAAASQPARVYLATYSGVPVYEATVRGIACMRRRADGYHNATQILKVAGVEKTRRTKVLDKLILTGEHEKVQGGYGKYQGTWIPLQRARQLAAQFNVAYLLKPLLEFDPATEGNLTKAPKGKRPNPNAPSQQSVNRLPAQTPNRALSRKSSNTSNNESTSNSSAAAIVAAAAAAASSIPGFFQSAQNSSSFPPPPPAFAPPENGNSGVPSQTPRFLTLCRPSEEPASKRPRLEPPQGIEMSDDHANQSGLAGQAFETNFDNTTDSAYLFDRSSPVRDLNTLGPDGGLLRAAALAPDDAKNDPRRSTKGARAVLGPPENLANDPSTRYADRPQAFHATGADEAQERALKDVLSNVFLAGHSEVDANSQSSTPSTQLQALLARMAAALAQVSGPTVSIPAVSVNIIIDDHGHAPLHWAAALGQVGLVKMLVSLPPSQGGANVQAGNHAGETALHRAVLVTNGYESNVFREIIGLLHESISTRDYKRRSILHHIAMVAALRGRATSARYYLGAVLDALFPTRLGRAAEDGTETNGSEPLIPPNEARDLIDAQDDDGETALGIVARIGSASMIRMLLGCGARKDIPNNLGIRPSDWGVGSSSAMTDEPAPTASYGTSFLNRPSKPIQRQETLQSIQTTLSELKDLHAEEMTSKNESVAAAQVALQVATHDLAAQRRQLEEAEKREEELDQAKHTVAHLERLVASLSSPAADPPIEPEDVQEFAMLENQRSRAGSPPWGDFLKDIVCPHPVEGQGSELELIRLRWLASALRQQAELWNTRGRVVTAQAAAHAAQCRRVVALCCNVDEGRVEEILEDLVVAVESDGPSVDLARVAGFMDVVKPPSPGIGEALGPTSREVPSQPTSPVGP